MGELSRRVMILEIITLRDNSPFHNSPISHTLLQGRFMIGSRALQYVRITNIIENDPHIARKRSLQPGLCCSL